MVALPKDIAEKLAAKIYGKNANDFIDQISGSDYNVGTATRYNSYFSNGRFLELTKTITSSQRTYTSFMVVPSYWAEFLEIKKDGTILGLKDINNVDASCSILARIRSDFNKTAHVHFLPVQKKGKNNLIEQQQAVYVERALEVLKQTQKTLNILGQEFTVHELSDDFEDPEPHNGTISYLDSLDLSFNNAIDPEDINLEISSQRKTGPLSLATKLPKKIKVQIGKRCTYELRPA